MILVVLSSFRTLTESLINLGVAVFVRRAELKAQLGLQTVLNPKQITERRTLKTTMAMRGSVFMQEQVRKKIHRAQWTAGLVGRYK
jgi:hypothetical protein